MRNIDEARKESAGSCSIFTLVELLVVVAIIGILMTVLLPALNSSKELAKKSDCCNNLRQTGIALASYVQDSGNQLPLFWDGGSILWMYQINPYMGKSSGTEFNSSWICKSSKYQLKKTVGGTQSYSYGLLNSVSGQNLNGISNPSRRFVIAEGNQAYNWESCGSKINAWFGNVPTPPAYDTDEVASSYTAYFRFRHRGSFTVLYMDSHVLSHSKAEADNSSTWNSHLYQ